MGVRTSRPLAQTSRQSACPIDVGGPPGGFSALQTHLAGAEGVGPEGERARASAQARAGRAYWY